MITQKIPVHFAPDKNQKFQNTLYFAKKRGISTRSFLQIFTQKISQTSRHAEKTFHHICNNSKLNNRLENYLLTSTHYI